MDTQTFEEVWDKVKEVGIATVIEQNLIDMHRVENDMSDVFKDIRERTAYAFNDAERLRRKNCLER